MGRPESNGELEAIKNKRMKEWFETKRSTEHPASPITVSDDDFGNLVRKHSLLVVDCWAPWCRPCAMIAPTIEELARRYAGKIVFGKLNVDQNPRTANQFNVTGIPTLLVMKEGRIVDRIVGAVPRAQIEARLNVHL